MSSPIIVGVGLREDDDAPIAFAEALAGLTGAPLALVTSYPFGGSPLFLTPESVASLREQAKHALARTAKQIAEDIEVCTYVRPEMSAALALHDIAIELDAAAIVVGSSHRGRLGRVLAGSVGAGLLHGAPCPVAIAPRGYKRRPEELRSIGVGYVDTLEGRSALSAGSGLARATGARVAVFTVAEPIAWSPALIIPGWSFPKAFDAERDSAAQRAADTARKLIPGELLASVDAPVGDPATILAEASADLDLLVCGSRGYGPVRSVILGSVSRALAHSAACPLLVVPRPPAEDATKLWRNRAAPRAVAEP